MLNFLGENYTEKHWSSANKLSNLIIPEWERIYSSFSIIGLEPHMITQMIWSSAAMYWKWNVENKFLPTYLSLVSLKCPVAASNAFLRCKRICGQSTSYRWVFVWVLCLLYWQLSTKNVFRRTNRLVNQKKRK